MYHWLQTSQQLDISVTFLDAVGSSRSLFHSSMLSLEAVLILHIATLTAADSFMEEKVVIHFLV